MRKPLRLLVAVDFSDASRRALKAAAAIARRTGASVTIVHARPSSDLKALVLEDRGDLARLSAKLLRHSLAAHYRKRLEEARRLFPKARVRLLVGYPALMIAKEAAHGFDLVVIGSRGRGAVSRGLLGSTTQELLRRAKVPVMVVESPSRSLR
jgi:nucleotide-binding universal stress UspA family protein